MAPGDARGRLKLVASRASGEDEIERLFSVIQSVRDRAIFQIAYRAGLRASEIGLLQMRDYDPRLVASQQSLRELPVRSQNPLNVVNMLPGQPNAPPACSWRPSLTART